MSSRTLKAALLLVLPNILIGACMPSTTPTPRLQDTPLATARGHCGDGVCEGLETAEKCPADCTTQSPVGDQTTPATPVILPAEDEPVLYLGIMVHLEHWDDAASKAARAILNLASRRDPSLTSAEQYPGNKPH